MQTLGRRLNIRFLPVRSLYCLLICLCVHAVTLSISRADEPQSTPAKNTPALPANAESSENSIAPLPAAFSKSVPTSVEDLQSIQDHVTKLVPRLTECTVSLRIGRAQGSGVIVTADGLILSAAHVTGPPGKPVIIMTADGKQYDGITLGRNNTLDGSMVQIDSDRKDWPHRPLAKINCKPGDWCATLGHPGGYQRDRGLVLRLGRVIDRNDWIVQTDCELIGGDSGGPLFNMQGEIIGINTRIGESTQYNFHVPASAFLRDWDRLLANEDFKSHSGAYLGIGGVPAETGEGLLIQTVEPETPASRAGLKPGDTLLMFQGVPVKDLEQLTELVGEEPPGRSVRLVLLRGEKSEEMSVRLGMRLNR